jgi:predicted Zn-dependent protease
MNPAKKETAKPVQSPHRAWSLLRTLGMREIWWAFLDLWESRRGLRLSLLFAGVAGVLAVTATLWIYPWWRQRTAVDMARQWLVAGRLEQASESIQEAIKISPRRPETWQLAGDLARRLGNANSALIYSRKAVELVPADSDRVLTWASDALLAGQPDETRQALASLPPTEFVGSARAQRIAGELARRHLDFGTARKHFENALSLEGAVAINEVPLGIVLLRSSIPDVRQRGLDLLAKWVKDPEWGANASRNLLQDALAHDDRTSMLRWADSLRGHPRCTLGDLPDCLLALSKADERRFAEVLRTMKASHETDTANIALLVSWLNQIGRSAEAVGWIRTLPPEKVRKPPAAVSAAESLRHVADWPGLMEWVSSGDWGSDLEPVRLGYELLAARRSERTAEATYAWETLSARAAADGGRTLFVAESLYAWGLRDEALMLLWMATEIPEIAVQSLGTLARHYQVERDSDGQFRVFKRLRSLRTQDHSVANNYAFFAALTGNDLRLAEQIAADNHHRYPANRAYLGTYALTLLVQNRAAEAIKLLQPSLTGLKAGPEIALAYGLALAATGERQKAGEVLATLDPATLTTHESSRIAQAIR